MSIRFSIVFALLFCAVSAHAEVPVCGSGTPPAAENPELKCEGDDAACDAWRRFRSTYPYPYQTLAVDMLADGREAVVIVSEPAPVASKSEIAAHVVALFGEAAVAKVSARTATGVDGWLEDLVLRVKVEGGAAAPVVTANGESLSLAPEFVDRLQFLYRTLFGTSEGFYVDTVLKSPRVRTATLEGIKISTREIVEITSASGGWRRLDAASAKEAPWAEVARNERPAVYASASGSVVALSIPPKSNLAELRRHFRIFAVTTDYLVGALKPRAGGMILLGRNRQIPLDLLPPLRYETFASLAKSTGQPLGQSYERQRMFAGKIQAGPFKGWDWAPIYLSPQLQDSEFGTLLNLADQELKSWSECGRIRYHAFAYPTPAKFPFGDKAAMAWMRDEADASSLIFNWNTRAFAIAVDQPVGRVVSAYRTSALPVTYIVPDDSSSTLIAAMQRLLKREESKKRLEDPAGVGSLKGSDYFAELGDPTLARVVQNVFLYQSLSEIQPFKLRQPSKSRPPTAARSEVVGKIIHDQTRRWLQELKLLESASEAAALARTSGLSASDLADLLAAPEKGTRQLVKIRADYENQDAAARALWARLASQGPDLARMLEADFRRRCSNVSGSVTTVTTSDGKERLKCSWRGRHYERFPEDAESRRMKVFEAEFNRLVREFETVKGLREKTIAEYNALATQLKTANAVADELRAQASIADNLDGVLREVLKASEATASTGFIQTPTVVLSRNDVEQDSVGGHNIDALPWGVRAAKADAATVVRIENNRPYVIMSPSQMGSSNDVARAVATKSAVESAPPRPLEEALGVKEAPKGTLLERIRNEEALRAETSPDVMQRALQCRCDVYVERGSAETATIVSLKPPPSSRTVFGTVKLIESLAERAKGSRVVFAGFSAERATALGEGALRVAKARGQEGSLAALTRLGGAREIFERSVGRLSGVFQMTTKEGRKATVAMRAEAPYERLAELLSSNPGWRGVKFSTAKRGMDVSTPLVEIKFPQRGQGELESVKAYAYTADGTSIRLVGAEGIAKVTSGNPILLDAVSRLSQHIFANTKGTSRVDFFLHTVGDVKTVQYLRGDELSLLR